jgi:hypothetical protein
MSEEPDQEQEEHSRTEEPTAEEAEEPAAPAAEETVEAVPHVAAPMEATPEQAMAISPNYRSPMPPPGPLFRVDGHWSPYLSPEVPEGAEVYIIKPGDTLWDITAAKMGDPYLWPQVWQYNLYIMDPHWIYPGDPLFLKPIIVLTPEVVRAALDTAREVVEGEEPEEDVVTPAMPDETGRAAEMQPEKPRFFLDVDVKGPRPAATFDEMYCSYFIASGKPAYDLRVVSLSEAEAETGAAKQVVYLNRGFEHGVAAGQEFAVFHIAEKDVRHPATKKALGRPVYRVGRARILSVQSRTAMAQVVESCREVRAGDGLEPWKEIPIPLYLDRPLDQANYQPSGGPAGYIVHAKDDIDLIGTRHIVTVDLGERQGVVPGDALTVYAENPAGGEFQRYLVAELIVLTAREGTATCKVMRATTEAGVGFHVEVK